MKIAAIMLAAGGSSRLGAAKQCLPVEGRPLLRRSVQVLLDSQVQRVIAVLGANAEACKMTIDDLPALRVFNSRWREGMAGSIILGLEAAVAADPGLDAVLIALCDQPMVTPQFIDRIIARYRDSHCGMVASEYGEGAGVPALFNRTYFPDLLALRGDRGARMLLQRKGVERIPFPQGAVDIDTREQYERVLRESVA